MSMNFPVPLNKKSGFTLVELVIVIALIGILYAISVPNFKGFMAERKLINAAQTFQEEIRVAAENARSQQKVFGVFLDEGSLVLSRSECELAVYDATTKNCPTASLEQITVNGLPFFEGHKIVPSNDFSIYFLPPQGETADAGVDAIPSKEVTFTNELGKTRTINTYLVTGLTEIYE